MKNRHLNDYKILMIAPQFHPLVGGYERAAMRLSCELSSRGHNVTVITERRDKQWPKREDFNGFNVRRLWCLFRPHWHMSTALFSFFIYLLFQGRQYQVWHVHQYGLHAVLAIATGKLLGRPVILKLTSSGKQGLEQASSNLPMSELSKNILMRVDKVVALTRETRKEAILFGIPSNRVILIGNGVEDNRFHPVESDKRTALRTRNHLSGQGLVVWVGRLSQEKNPDGLLEAWRIALPKLPNEWALIIVGDGPLLPTLKSTVDKYQLNQTVHLVGRQANVEEWLAMADIYVMTSHNEGLSNTMLEAMATGLPVVTTRVSGTEENIEEPEAGKVVACNDMEAVASALVGLASNPELRFRHGKQGRDVIDRKFSISRVAEQHLALYQKLINKSSKAT